MPQAAGTTATAPPVAAGAAAAVSGHSTPLGPGQPLRGEYRDASLLLDPPPDARRNRGGVTEPFPEKLHRMLSDVERDGITDVVSFFSHGRAFAIHKPRRFVREIMPHYFRQTRLTSFQRQLNLYGFQRISQGPDNGGYYHELFLRGRPGLCVNMKRTKVKGTTKTKRDPDTEPNFYAMPMPVSAGMLPFPPNYQATSAPVVPTPSATQPVPGAPPGTAPQQAYYPQNAILPNTPQLFSYPQMQQMPFSAAQQPTAAQAAYQSYYPNPYMMQQPFWNTGVSPMMAAQTPGAAPSPMAAAQAPQAPPLLPAGAAAGPYMAAQAPVNSATPMVQAQEGKNGGSEGAINVKVEPKEGSETQV